MRSYLERELAVRLDRARRGGQDLAAGQIGSTILVLAIAILTGLGTLSEPHGSSDRHRSRLQIPTPNLEEMVASRTKALSQANDGNPEIRLYRIPRPTGAAGQYHGLHDRIGERRQDRSAGISIDRIKANDDSVPKDVIEAIGEECPRPFAFIKTSTAKMDRLIGAILRLSREGRRVLTPETLPMRALVGKHRRNVQTPRGRG